MVVERTVVERTVVERIVVERIVVDFSSGLVAVVTSRPIENFPDSIVIKCVTNEQTSQVTPCKTSDYVSSIWHSYIPTSSLASIEVSIPDHGIIAIPVSDNSIVIKSFNQKSLSSKRQSFLTEEKEGKSG